MRSADEKDLAQYSLSTSSGILSWEDLLLSGQTFPSIQDATRTEEISMSFRERVLLGIIASGLALSMFAPSCDPKPVMPDGYVEQERSQ